MSEDKEVTTQEKERLQFKKCLVVLCGPPLSGKTTLGRELAKHSNFAFLDVDEARWEIFLKSDRLPDKQEQFAMQTSYQKNHEKARDLLQLRQPVIVAATYSRELYHQMLQDLAERNGAELRVFLLVVSDEEIRRRIENRANENPSVIKTFEQFSEVKNRYRVIEGVRLVKIDTSLSVEENAGQIFYSLEDLRI